MSQNEHVHVRAALHYILKLIQYNFVIYLAAGTTVGAAAINNESDE